MGDMVVKGVAAKNQEAVHFAAFNKWCGDQLRIKGNEIVAGTTQIEQLNADIEQCDVDIRSLTSRINELDEDVGRWKKDQVSVQDIREKEAVDFKATVADYSETLSALASAIDILKKQDYDRAQASLVQSFVQLRRSSLIPVSTKNALAAFLQESVPLSPDAMDRVPDAMPDAQLGYSAPEAYGYSFQSGGVVDMLIKLQDKFRSKKSELEVEEVNAKHAYEQVTQSLVDNVENANHEINKKSVLRANTQESKSGAQGDLSAATLERQQDETYKADTEALCAQKTSDFNSRQKLRADELTAIRKAIEIIGHKTVAGAGKEYLPSFIQGKHAFAQLRSNQQSPLQSRIADFLADRARLTGSALLSQVSVRVASDPFTKVKKMIKDLISKLMEESTSEAEHKGWCDTELTTNKLTREKKTEEVNTLNSEIEDLTATIAQLSQDISDLNAALKALAAAKVEATDERVSSKADNEKAIADAKAAQVAVEEAMAVLKNFYAKSAQATAFAQQTPAEDAPQTFNKPYTGLLPEGGNVIDILEVIFSDFSRLESDTFTQESMEAEEHKTFMFESEKDEALKQNDVKHKTAKTTSKQSALGSAEEELKLTQEALDKAVTYYEKLKPTCVDSGITYEERVKRREAEIQSLEEGLKILSGTDVDVA